MTIIIDFNNGQNYRHRGCKRSVHDREINIFHLCAYILSRPANRKYTLQNADAYLNYLKQKHFEVRMREAGRGGIDTLRLIQIEHYVFFASYGNNNCRAQSEADMSIVKQFKGNKILSSAEFVALFKKYDKDGTYGHYKRFMHERLRTGHSLI